jgi:predicted N-acetyltransferase YhbS
MLRQAKVSDVEGITSIIEEVAIAIPLKLDGVGAKEVLRSIIRGHCSVGPSFVEEDNGTIVGALLAKPILIGAPNLEIRFVAVAPNRQGNGVLSGLIESVKRENRPLSASVCETNSSDMANRLKHFGFEEVGESGWPGQSSFRWEPPG